MPLWHIRATLRWWQWMFSSSFSCHRSQRCPDTGLYLSHWASFHVKLKTAVLLENRRALFWIGRNEVFKNVVNMGFDKAPNLKFYIDDNYMYNRPPGIPVFEHLSDKPWQLNLKWNNSRVLCCEGTVSLQRVDVNVIVNLKDHTSVFIVHMGEFGTNGAVHNLHLQDRPPVSQCIQRCEPLCFYQLSFVRV